MRAQEFANPRVGVKLIDDRTGEHVRLNLPVTRRTADKAFWTWTAVSQAFTIADNENSVYALKLPGTHESNFIYGRDPGRARYYAIGEAIFALGSCISWRDKRERDAAVAFGARPDRTHRYWWLPQASNIAWHAIGIGITIGRTHR